MLFALICIEHCGGVAGSQCNQSVSCPNLESALFLRSQAIGCKPVIFSSQRGSNILPEGHSLSPVVHRHIC